MPSVTESITIAAPVDRVYRFVTSPSNWLKFVSGLIGISAVSSDMMEPGTTFDWEYRMMGVPLRGKGHVNQNVPSSKFSMKMEGAISVTESYTFTPAAGGTELSIHIDYEIPGKVAEAVESAILAHYNTAEGESTLERIKALCEQG